MGDGYLLVLDPAADGGAAAGVRCLSPSWVYIHIPQGGCKPRTQFGANLGGVRFWHPPVPGITAAAVTRQLHFWGLIVTNPQEVMLTYSSLALVLGLHCAAADLSMFPNVSTCSALSGMVGDVVDCCYGGILPISTPHFNSEGGISGGLHQVAPKLRGSSTYMLVYMWAGPGEDIQRTRDLSGLVGATACAPTLLGPGWTMPHAHSLSAGGLTSTVAGAWFPTSLDPQPDALWRPSVGDR